MLEGGDGSESRLAGLCDELRMMGGECENEGTREESSRRMTVMLLSVVRVFVVAGLAVVVVGVEVVEIGVSKRNETKTQT